MQGRTAWGILVDLFKGGGLTECIAAEAEGRCTLSISKMVCLKPKMEKEQSAGIVRIFTFAIISEITKTKATGNYQGVHD